MRIINIIINIIFKLNLNIIVNVIINGFGGWDTSEEGRGWSGNFSGFRDFVSFFASQIPT